MVIWMVVWWPMHLNVSEKKGFLYSRNFQCSQIQCIVTYSYHLGEALQHWNYAKGNQLELFPGSSNLDNNRSSHIQLWQKGGGGFLGCVCVQYFTIIIRTIFRTALPDRQWIMTWRMAQFILSSFFRARFSEKNYWKRTSKKNLSILLKEKTNKQIDNTVFSHDVTAAILVSQNNKTVAMLVSQTNPVGVELFSYANAFFCSNKFAKVLATWVKTLYIYGLW